MAKVVEKNVENILTTRNNVNDILLTYKWVTIMRSDIISYGAYC